MYTYLFKMISLLALVNPAFDLGLNSHLTGLTLPEHLPSIRCPCTFLPHVAENILYQQMLIVGSSSVHYQSMITGMLYIFLKNECSYFMNELLFIWDLSALKEV